MKCICHARKFETLVRLRRGTTPRTVRMVVATRLDEPDRLAPSRVVEAFYRAVEVGLLGPIEVTERQDRIEVVRSYGVMNDVFEATFSPVAPNRFAPLARMVGVSVPGVVRFELCELNRDERTLLVTGFESEDETTILDVDWQIQLGSTDTTSLLVSFVEEPRIDVQKRLTEVLGAWAAMVELGAWPPSDDQPAGAVLSQLVSRGADVAAGFNSLACGYGAYEALFAALDEIHEQQALRRVVIPYRVNAASVRPPPPSGAGPRVTSRDTAGVDAHG